MEKLNSTSKLASILTSGVLLLTGCGVIKETTNEFVKDTNITTQTDTTEVNSTETEVNSTEETKFESKNKTEKRNETIQESNTSSTTNIQTDIQSPCIETSISISTTSKTNTITIDPRTETTTTTQSEYTLSSSNNDKLPNLLGEINTYSYVDSLEEYEIKDEDTLDTIALKFHTTKSVLMEKNNLTSEDISGLTTIYYPVKDEYINVRKASDIQSIATVEGLSVEVIRKLNGISENETIIPKDAAIRLHRFIGDENSYETYKGTSNVIYNNKIMGEKVLIATGFAGASQKVVVLFTTPFEDSINTVTQYTFDGNQSYTSDILCFNAKDIELKGGMPAIYLRSDEDIIKIAEKNNVRIDETNILQWQSQNNTDYQLYEDEKGFFFVINGYQLHNSSQKKYTK